MNGSPARWLLAGLLAALLAACGSPRAPRQGSDADAWLDRGRADARTWVAAAEADRRLDDARVIALGYLERQRLGLGSPFRLAEFALRDPRLGPAGERRVAWAILARAEDAQGDVVEPEALDPIATTYPWQGTGSAQLKLIEGAIHEARDPRAGELAVRLAYALAAAEGAVSRAAPALAAEAAALVRDRELARRDARRLLATADRERVDALDLLVRWRAERRFVVERPLVESLPLDAEAEAIALAPRLAEAIRTLPRDPRWRQASRRPLLPSDLAVRLSALADTLNPPPEAPVAVTLRVHRTELLEGHGLDLADSVAADRFSAGAGDEERFAAGLALLREQTHTRADIPARVGLAAAVALRTYGQEPVWFPGDGGPSTADLEGRFGLAAVRFDGDVPDAWHPYYRRMLAMALTDLERVLPALDVHGLSVRFGAVPRRSTTTLAMHDPTQRVVYFPPATGAGTMAHELAHDLDWQVALRRYRVRGDYATDRATRRGKGRLASSLQELADGALEPPVPGAAHPSHRNRPAEVFARSVDWFVSQALGQEGRLDGYLSSVQDGVLTGYGSVTPPDYTGKAGDALIAILDDVAPLPAATRRWYLEHHGMGRPLNAYDLVRTVLEAPVPVEPDLVLTAAAPVTPDDTVTSATREVPALALADARFAAVAGARDQALRAIDEWVCDVPGAAYDRKLQRARRELVTQAAQARAFGVALHRAEEIAGWPGRSWMAHRLFGDPWPDVPVDPATASLLSNLEARARAVGREGPALQKDGFRLVTPAGRCAAGPLMSAGGGVAGTAPVAAAGAAYSARRN